MNKIFFIDDNQNLCIIWKLLFERNGYDIEVFQDGEAALARAEASSYPDIVITDYNLPGIDGVELLQQMQKHNPIVPIILTGDKEKLEASPNIPKDFILLSKPIQFEKIKGIIESQRPQGASASTGL